MNVVVLRRKLYCWPNVKRASVDFLCFGANFRLPSVSIFCADEAYFRSTPPPFERGASEMPRDYLPAPALGFRRAPSIQHSWILGVFVATSIHDATLGARAASRYGIHIFCFPTSAHFSSFKATICFFFV